MDGRSSSDHAAWYESVYPELTGYGLWLRGGEANTLPADEYEKRPFRALFVRLSTYADVASSFTHHLLYRAAASVPDVFPDLAYLPPAGDAALFARNGIPWLIGTQTKRDAFGFHLIGFSNSIVQELVNIPHFLTTSGIPLARSERLAQAAVPLIILGGANATFASALWGTDSPVDGVYIGHDAASVKRLLMISAAGRKRGAGKGEILAELEGVPGFYQADRPHPRPRAKAETENGPLAPGIIPYTEESIGAGHLPINEGCRANCSFCAENWVRKPYRETGKDMIVRQALEMKAGMGLEKIDLYSFNFNMHTRFYALLWDLIPLFASIGLKSQRLDMLTQDPTMVECQTACGKTTFSAGVEGISPRLRRYLNKNLSDDALRKSVDLIFKAKARELKVFLLSTGLENDNDFAAFDGLLAFIRKAKAAHGAGTRIIISITPLVRFPWTPLEFDEAAPKEIHDEVIARIKKDASAHGFEAREAMDTTEYLLSQVLVRSSEPGVFNALLRAIRDTRFVYYRGVPPAFLAAFESRLREAGLPLATLLAGATFEESAAKPWAELDTGVERRLLWKACVGNRAGDEIGTGLETLKTEPPAHTPAEYKERVRSALDDATPVSFAVDIGDRGRGLPRRYLGVVLASALMQADTSLSSHFRSYVSSRWTGTDGRPAWVIGMDIITLSWHRAGLPLIEKRIAEKAFLKKVNVRLDGWARLTGFSWPAALTPPMTYRLHITSPYPVKGAAYFMDRGLKHTLVKDRTRGTSILQFSKDALKKDIVRSCSYLSGDGRTMDLEPGRKFETSEFLREAFCCPHKNDWVRIAAKAFIHTA